MSARPSSTDLSDENGEETSVDLLFEKTLCDSSSEDPPMDEWTSILEITPPDSPKVALFKQGLYKPGSGEICAKYLALSDSNVLRHAYYNYPAITDPGIITALLQPEPTKTFPYDGQELYLYLCQTMNLVPVRSFHKGLLKEEIDLKYYGVNPVGVHAMCLALVNNKYVRRLDLTSNHLSRDAFYHLGQLLGDSFTLQELMLSGCKLGPEGLRMLLARMSRRTMELLDLSKNSIGDEGFQYLSILIAKGTIIKRLNLSSNELTSISGLALAEAIECGNNTITHLDLSWNKMFVANGLGALLSVLGSSPVLEELNLSWNAITHSAALRKIAGSQSLQLLDLSNNRLSIKAVKAITARIHVAQKLHTLDLSHNSMSPDEALVMLDKMKDSRVKLENLYMEDTPVTKVFLETLQEVLSLEYRANATITYGKVLKNYTPSPRSLKEIVLKRLGYVTRPTKSRPLHVAQILLQAHKETSIIEPNELLRNLKRASMPVHQELIDQVTLCFPGPLTDKGFRTINLDSVLEYVRRLWPEQKLPPTPPPTIEIVAKPKGLKKKKK